MEWMILPYKRYADFSGRSRRKEYWMFTLLGFIVVIVTVGLMFAGGAESIMAATENPDAVASPPGALFWIGAGLLGIFGLGSIIPSIAVAVRRFHDRDMTGWWVLIFAVLGALPYIGWIATIANIVIMALPGTPGPNRFGEDPLNPVNTSVFE